jgi:hypothetical protein
MGEPVGLAHVRALILALTIAFSASAHEIGTTEVRAVFGKDHTYTIDVLTPREPLLRKLGGSLDPVRLAKSAHVAFGDREVHPRVSGIAGGIRYHGEVPRNAGPFTWRYDLTYASYSLVIETPVSRRHEWLEGDARSAPFPLDRSLLPPARADVFLQYLTLGFTHIVPYGLDHMLFVLGMVLLSRGIKPVLTQVTAFTVAHSITLALTMYGFVALPPRIVEPLIALSIAWIAIENLVVRRLHTWRVVLVFVFGLLHGLGFAGVLRELGLPRSEALTGLVAFNVGVELGQLAVIACAWVMVLRWSQGQPWYRRRVLVPASLAIAVAGLTWMAERI